MDARKRVPPEGDMISARPKSLRRAAPPPGWDYYSSGDVASQARPNGRRFFGLLFHKKKQPRPALPETEPALIGHLDLVFFSAA